MGKKLKQMTALILAGVVVFNSGSAGASAATLKVPIELESTHMFSDPYSSGPGGSIRDGGNYFLPELKAGNYEKWIDRIELSKEIRDFYTVLEEAADFDGKDDFLIDPNGSNLVVENDGAMGRGVLVTQIRGEGKDWNSAKDALQKDFDKKSSELLAVFETFDRDHPEVFWLNGSTYITDTDFKCSGDIDKETDELICICTGDIYFMLESEAHDWTIWHEKYQDKDAILSANTMVEKRVKELTNAVKGKSAVEQMRYFNQWLTNHNEYNYQIGYVGTNANTVIRKQPDTFECTSALQGLIGREGPVCEAYARAFKVLCDNAGIPCVLVDGNAYNGEGAENHMWNYVKVDGSWYAVDVTWNDPLGGASGAISGYECETYFLVGSETLTFLGNSQMKFIESHPEENRVSKDRNQFVNGPVLSQTAYDLKAIPKPSPTPEPMQMQDVSKVFADINSSAWYKESVQYVYDKGLMSGSNGYFKPQNNVKRAQVIVTLYRLSGSPKVTDIRALVELVDLNPTAYYADAACWAYNEGIITGTGEGNRYFYGEDPVKRQQIAAILRRYASTMGQETTEKADISYMLNANAVSSYAIGDVEWAVAAGLLSGSETKDANGNTVYDLKPHATATRGQLAAILMRFCENNGY